MMLETPLAQFEPLTVPARTTVHTQSSGAVPALIRPSNRGYRLIASRTSLANEYKKAKYAWQSRKCL